MLYQGPERRVHTIFVTKNREYHTRDGFCVAVRDIKSTAWMTCHDALGMELDLDCSGPIFQGNPLVFRSDLRAVQTSPVMDIMRPAKQIFEVYNLVEQLLPA